MPSNIVKPKWGLISGKPAGFADGVDNQGITKVRVTMKEGGLVNVQTNGSTLSQVNCPAGGVVIGGGMNSRTLGTVVEQSYPATGQDQNQWIVSGRDVQGTGGQFTPWAVWLSVDPASAITVARRGKIGVASRAKKYLRR